VWRDRSLSTPLVRHAMRDKLGRVSHLPGSPSAESRGRMYRGWPRTESARAIGNAAEAGRAAANSRPRTPTKRWRVRNAAESGVGAREAATGSRRRSAGVRP
jgi:hypothetical protein